MNRAIQRPIFDVHSHWGTEFAYRFRSDRQLELQRRTWGSTPSYVSESEMADQLRASSVKAILDLGFTKDLPIEDVREYHDYAIEFQAQNPDVVIGNWINIDTRDQEAALDELRRVRSESDGFVGLVVSGTSLGVPASDPLWDPFYHYATETQMPVLILVGYTGTGAGLPGGGGKLLEHCHPRHVDRVAAAYPDLPIVAGRPAWPWQDEMIAILLHKSSVMYELHGWSPRYHTASLKHDISRRLKERVMFGADYPLFTYERLVDDWEAEDYEPEVLDHVFYENALKYFERFTRL